MKDYREDLKEEFIEAVKTLEYLNIKPLEEEKIKEIFEIIKICKNLSNTEQEKKRYEIRNICK